MDFDDVELRKLRELAELYATVKGRIIYAEEIDPKSNSNLQINKEMRDAYDHLMRVLNAKFNPNGHDYEYCSNNIDKAIGHTYRAGFDALDGTAMSLKELIFLLLQNYPHDVIREVLPNYWSYKLKINQITGGIVLNRSAKDIGDLNGEIFNRYVLNVEELKNIYDNIINHGPNLDECSAAHKRANWRKTVKEIAIHLAVAGCAGAMGWLTAHFHLM